MKNNIFEKPKKHLSPYHRSLQIFLQFLYARYLHFEKRDKLEDNRIKRTDKSSLQQTTAREKATLKNFKLDKIKLKIKAVST